MPIEHLIAALVVLLLITLIAQPVSGWLRLPYTSALVLLGFIVSELIVFFGIDTGIRADNYQSLVFYVFIPLLVYESAYRIDKRLLLGHLLPILFLAIIGMLISCLLVAVLVFYGIGHAQGFPWIAALITGAILAATDPVAVVAKLQELHTSPKLVVLLEGESLMNDAAAIVLFTLFLSIAASPSGGQSISVAIVQFVKVFAGGALVGIVLGYLASAVDRYMANYMMTGLIGLALAYGSYMVAESFHVSGVMSTLMAAILLSVKGHGHNASKEIHHVDVIDALAFIANAFVFIIVGAVITVSMFEERWLAMLIAIAAVLVARTVSTVGGLSVLSLFQKQRVELKQQVVMVWGGLRGAVTLALALSLPTTLDSWWTIQSIAFGVVVFTLFVQAPSIHLLIKRTGVG